LIGEPPVNPLVEMRRLDVKEHNPQAGRDGDNSNIDPGKSFEPSGHAIGIVSVRALFKSRHKAPDSFQNMPVDVLLGLIARFQVALGNMKGVVASVHDQHLIRRAHSYANFVEEQERTERIARSLDEKDGCPNFPEHFVAEFIRISTAAKRIS